MPAYAVTGRTAGDSTADTCLSIQRGASKRFKLYDFTVGHSGTPADNAILWVAGRSTTAGTHTDVPTMSLDQADGDAVATAGEDFSAEPTYTADSSFWEQAINQRASYRWVAAPGGEVVVPNTADNGLGWLPSHASYNGNTEVTAHFTE